jgi:hypothetical protein
VSVARSAYPGEAAGASSAAGAAIAAKQKKEKKGLVLGFCNFGGDFPSLATLLRCGGFVSAEEGIRRGRDASRGSGVLLGFDGFG